MYNIKKKNYSNTSVRFANSNSNTEQYTVIDYKVQKLKCATEMAKSRYMPTIESL